MKLLKYLALAGGILVVLMLIAGLAAWRAAQHEEAWYTEAVAVASPAEIEQAEVAGDEFERQALDLSNSAKRTGHWEAVFTDQQINGWLASDLMEKFPKALPSTVKAPRVKFEKELAKVACRIVTSTADTVLVIGVDLYLTENPNELAVRIKDTRAGLLPVPRKRVIDTVTKAAEKNNVRLKWAQTDGDPVALFTIPQDYEEIDGRLLVEKVELREGKIHLVGRTIREDGSGGTSNVQHIIVSHLTEKDTLHR